MEMQFTGNPYKDLISVLGQKEPDKKHIKSVISLHDEVAATHASRHANTLAERAIALSLGIYAGHLHSPNDQKCKADIDEALRIDKTLPKVQIALGCYYYFCLKDNKKAKNIFTDAKTKHPGNFEPIFYLAMVNRTTGNWKEVQALLEELKIFDIEDPLVLTNIGLCYEYLHDFDAALNHHQKAIVVKDDWEPAFQNQFRTLLLKHDSSTAAGNILKSLISISKSNYTEFQIKLDIYVEKYKDALDKANKAKPGDFTIKGARSVYLGDICSEIPGCDASVYYKAALKELDKLLTTNPDNADINSLIGLAHAGLCNEHAAVKAGEKAITLAKKAKNDMLESEMVINLAKIYSRLCKKEKAIEKIDEVLGRPSLFSTKMLQHDPVWKSVLHEPALDAVINKYDDQILTP